MKQNRSVIHRNVSQSFTMKIICHKQVKWTLLQIYKDFLLRIVI